MGIIRKIIFTFSFLFVCGLSAQTVSDTVVFDGDTYVKHIVTAGESLKSIAKLHKVKTADIIDNNEIQKRLYYNQLLYIPISSNQPKSKETNLSIQKQIELATELTDTSELNIALLMPYYLIKNDTMFNNYKGTLGSTVWNKSKSALSFHIGIELALDSLRRAGRNIVLHTFDTNQDTLEVRKIIYSNRLNNMDVIIGPLYSKFFQMLCKKYGKDTSKVLIAPLSIINTKAISIYPAVYQISPTNKLQTEILTDYLLANKKDERIVLLHDKKEKGLSVYVKHLFNTAGKEVSVFQVKNTKVDSIRKFFTEQQNVMLLSSNKAFISKILGSIGSIDSISTVFAFESVKGFDNLDITNLMELDVHILNSRSVDYSKNYDLRFLKLFELEYKTNERKYTKVAYDIIMHFCGNSNVYEFKQNSFGFKQNTLTPIFHYSDYELIPVE